MSFNPNAPSPSTEFNLIPSGVHAARCARIIEIGKQHAPKFDRIDPDTGAVIKSVSDKVIIMFALCNVLFDIPGLGEKQAFIFNRYGITQSTSDRSAMKQYTKALDPKGETSHLREWLVRPAQVSIKHVNKDGKTYANLDSVAPILPGIQLPELDVPAWMFEWDNPDYDLWLKLSEQQQELIKSAENFRGSPVEQMLLDNSSDAIKI